MMLRYSQIAHRLFSHAVSQNYPFRCPVLLTSLDFWDSLPASKNNLYSYSEIFDAIHNFNLVSFVVLSLVELGHYVTSSDDGFQP